MAILMAYKTMKIRDESYLKVEAQTYFQRYNLALTIALTLRSLIFCIPQALVAPDMAYFEKQSMSHI